MTSVSVIICTYNRADSLARTLRTLADQKDVCWSSIEVLVVDNNSTDHTKSVIDPYATQLPIKYIKEPHQGLSHARNRGVHESSGDALIFTDDDVRMDECWLHAYLEALEKFPEIGFFGGRIQPDWTVCPRPAWLVDERLPLLSGVVLSFDFGGETRLYREGEDGPIGASFAVRRRLFAEFGGFRTDLGVKGNSRGRGEETEFFERARSNRERGVYVGGALCWHWVYPERLTVLGLLRHGIAKGQSHHIAIGDTNSGSITVAIGFLVRGVHQLLKGRGDRFRQCVINIGIQIGMRGRVSR